MKEIVFATGFNTSLAIPQEDVHLEMLVRGFNDTSITQYLGRVGPMYVEAEREWIRNMGKRDTSNQVFIVVAHDDVARIPIGTMGLHNIDHINRTATSGAAILNKDYWGKAHGSEAKMHLLKYAFDYLNLRKVRSAVLANNPRSKRYNERCGYIVEGILKEERFRDGGYVDEYRMAVTRERWLPIWQRYLSNGNGSIL